MRAPGPGTDEETATVSVAVYRDTVFELHVIAGAPPAVHRIRAGSNVVIGRSRAANVLVDHPTISRRHASVRLAHPILLTDLGSHNGTTVRGSPVAAHHSVSIEESEPFVLGTVSFLLRRAHTEAPPSRPSSVPNASLQKEVEALEKARIVEALARSGGNQSKAAAELGISRRTLGIRMETYGIPRPRKGEG